MLIFIEKYIASKHMSWSLSTIKSEKHRLLSIKDWINGNPTYLLDNISKKYNKYSAKTIFIRVGEFWEFTYPNEINPYKKFMKDNCNLFKSSYIKKILNVTYEEALLKINTITDIGIKNKALDLISTGMRFTESITERDGVIVGKGNKTRDVIRKGERPDNMEKTYSKVYRELKKVGLTPHMLRKLAATNAVEKGAKEADLCKIFGWNSFMTAINYIQPKNNNKLKDFLGR